MYIGVKLDPNESPPAANLYLEVEVEGPVLQDRLVIPRLAWHRGVVYVAKPDDTLEKRPVAVEFEQQDRLVIRDGLSAGERVIVTDILFPVDGMPVEPRIVENASI